jgi:hypothetical protein
LGSEILRAARDFIIGNSVLVGFIAVLGSLVVNDDRRQFNIISRHLSWSIITSALIAGVVFSLYFWYAYDDQLWIVPEGWFFGGYLFAAFGWAAGLSLCPPYLERIISEKRQTSPL